MFKYKSRDVIIIQLSEKLIFDYKNYIWKVMKAYYYRLKITENICINIKAGVLLIIRETNIRLKHFLAVSVYPL